MNKLLQQWKKIRLSFLLALMVFLIMLLSSVLTIVGMHILYSAGILQENRFWRVPIIISVLASILIGIVMAFAISYLPMKSIRKMMNAIHEIAKGNYEVRIHIKKPEELKELAESINQMAEEIGSVEMLRSDFINNFSHEFKTPIVSIRGFAKLLKCQDLTDEEREEYLGIIVAESERLSTLSTNVLELTKLEKQAILSGQKTYNISEQIRLVVALFDRKWSSRHIEISVEEREATVYGNEEMLQQVWINLLDNAIKFSPDYGLIEISIEDVEDGVFVRIKDQGSGMDEHTAKHIFDKFYQGDTSHTMQGNGLGLTIVARIIKLHQGEICVEKTGEDGTCFAVHLLKR